MRISDWSSDVCSSDLFREADNVVSPFNPSGEPAKGVEVHFTEAANGTLTPYLTIEGRGFLTNEGLGASAENLRVVFRVGQDEVVVTSENFVFSGDKDVGRITMKLPQRVLLGAATVHVERPIAGEYESE